MKKMILPFVALVLAGSLSAFTVKSSSTDNLFYWYDQSNGDFVGTSSSPTVNPLGCYDPGFNCIKGYLEPSQPITEPTRDPEAEYSRD